MSGFGQTLAMALVVSLPFLLALLLGVGGPALGWWLYRRVEVGLGFMALVAGVDAVFFGSMRLNLGINVYPADLAFVLLGAVAALRWILAVDVPSRPLAWWVFAAAFLVALVVGLARHGTTAGVHAREHFYALAAASYFMSFPLDAARVRSLLGTMVVLSMVMLAVAAWRWTTYLLPIPSMLPPGGVWSPDGPLRVIPSNDALLVAQVLVLAVLFPALAPSLMAARWAAPLLLGAVLVLQHRSVWIATLVGVVGAIALAPRFQARRGVQVLALLAVMALTALPLLFSERLSGLSQQVGRSAATAVAGQGTVHARLQDWRSTLSRWSNDGPLTWTLGWGFGRDTSRVVVNERGERHRVAFGAHNHYVALLADTGLVGLLAFLAVAAGALVGLHRLARHGDRLAGALLVLLLMQLAYYVPYGTDAWQHALLGLAIAYVGTQRRAAAPPGRKSARAWSAIPAWTRGPA